MTYMKILFISLSLAADAFAVSLCKGINTSICTVSKCLKVGLYFGIMQGIMPLLGFIIGNEIYYLLNIIGHYVVFFFLVVIGVSMIYDTFCEHENKYFDDFSFITLLLLAIATSIDAFSVGITFAFVKVNLLLAIVSISVTAFLLSSIGVFIGNKFGRDDSKKAKMIGGVILIIMAIELLLEHIN